MTAMPRLAVSLHDMASLVARGHARSYDLNSARICCAGTTSSFEQMHPNLHHTCGDTVRLYCD